MTFFWIIMEKKPNPNSRNVSACPANVLKVACFLCSVAVAGFLSQSCFHHSVAMVYSLSGTTYSVQRRTTTMNHDHATFNVHSTYSISIKLSPITHHHTYKYRYNCTCTSNTVRVPVPVVTSSFSRIQPGR